LIAQKGQVLILQGEDIKTKAIIKDVVFFYSSSFCAPFQVKSQTASASSFLAPKVWTWRFAIAKTKGTSREFTNGASFLWTSITTKTLFVISCLKINQVIKIHTNYLIHMSWKRKEMSMSHCTIGYTLTYFNSFPNP